MVRWLRALLAQLREAGRGLLEKLEEQVGCSSPEVWNGVLVTYYPTKLPKALVDNHVMEDAYHQQFRRVDRTTGSLEAPLELLGADLGTIQAHLGLLESLGVAEALT